MKWYIRALLLVPAILLGSLGHTEELELPSDREHALVGELRYTRVWRGDSLLDIARAFDIGHDQILRANPRLNRWIPRVGSEVVLPSLYILPPTLRQGIVLNLAELRLYYYPPSQDVVHTFPTSIGDVDWQTPIGKTKIRSKDVDPAWYPPKSIRQEHAEDGEELPTMIPGGDADNPLGHFALRLGIPGYLIHGTDRRRSFGIGMRVSHGCIRLYPEDIETLYSMVRVGTPVHIINQPVKAGWRGDALYLEVHHPLIEDGESDIEGPTMNDVMAVISPYIEPGLDIDAERVDSALRLGDGIPVAIAYREPLEP